MLRWLDMAQILDATARACAADTADRSILGRRTSAADNCCSPPAIPQHRCDPERAAVASSPDLATSACSAAPAREGAES